MHMYLESENTLFFNISNVGLFNLKSDMQIIKHSHDFPEIGLVLSGEGFYHVNDEMHMISEGDILITAPGCIHYEKSKEACAIEIMYLGFRITDFLRENYNDIISQSRLIHSGSAGEIHRIIKSILVETLEQQTDYKYVLEIEMMKLFILINRHFKSNKQITDYPNSLPELVKFHRSTISIEVKDFILKNLNTNIDVKDIASRFFISPSYLMQVFKETYHTTIKHFMTYSRIERAKEMLQDTNHEISMIAKLLGYQDINYFFRVFKKYTNHTPLQYRNTFIKKNKK